MHGWMPALTPACVTRHVHRGAHAPPQASGKDPSAPSAGHAKRYIHTSIILLVQRLPAGDGLKVQYRTVVPRAGAMSRSFTSSAVAVTTKNQRTLVRLERNPTKKGYVRLHTNLGDINVELHCDLVPR